MEQIRTANEICALAFRREVVNEEWEFSPSDRAEKIRARVLYCMSSFAAAKGDYQKAVNYIGEGLSIDERLDDKPMVAADYRTSFTATIIRLCRLNGWKREFWWTTRFTTLKCTTKSALSG